MNSVFDRNAKMYEENENIGRDTTQVAAQDAYGADCQEECNGKGGPCEFCSFQGDGGKWQ